MLKVHKRIIDEALHDYRNEVSGRYYQKLSGINCSEKTLAQLRDDILMVDEAIEIVSNVQIK